MSRGPPSASERRPEIDLIRIKAGLRENAMDRGSCWRPLMPAHALPLVLAIVAAFSAFMGVLGGVWIWSNIGD